MSKTQGDEKFQIPQQLVNQNVLYLGGKAMDTIFGSWSY